MMAYDQLMRDQFLGCMSEQAPSFSWVMALNTLLLTVEVHGSPKRQGDPPPCLLRTLCWREQGFRGCCCPPCLVRLYVKKKRQREEETDANNNSSSSSSSRRNNNTSMRSNESGSNGGNGARCGCVPCHLRTLCWKQQGYQGCCCPPCLLRTME